MDLLSVFGKSSKKENLTITILPGFNCNLKCKMCHNWKVPAHKDTPDWIKVVNSLKLFRNNYKKIEVNIGGGEPYLHPVVYDIMKTCKNNEFRCSISTNSHSLTKSVIDKSIESGLNGFNLSLDSMDSKLHDEYRGIKGNYDKVLNAIKNIEDKADISITTVFMKANINEINDIAEFSISKKIVFNLQCVVQPFQDELKHDCHSSVEYKHLWPDDKEKINNSINQLIELKTKNSDKINNTVRQLNIFKNYFYKPNDFIKHKGCSLTDKQAITINPDGSAYICPFMKPIGNIKYQSLFKILKNKTTNNTIKKMNRCTKNCHHLMNCYYKDEI